MKLCRELGGMTFEEMMERMSSREIVQWMALNELEIEEDEFQRGKSKMVNSFR